jgi:hypothetical protein
MKATFEILGRPHTTPNGVSEWEAGVSIRRGEGWVPLFIVIARGFTKDNAIANAVKVLEVDENVRIDD